MADENEEDYTEQATAPVAPGALWGTNGMVVPGPTVQNVSEKRGQSFVKATPGYMQSIERQEAAGQAEADAIDDAARVEKEKAFQQKLIYDNELQNEYTRQEARANANAIWNKRINDARAQLDQRIQQASVEPTSWWADRTEGERTRARVGTWLSAFGAAITGGDNLAIKSINDSIERDIKVKQARSEKLMKLAEQSRGMLADAYREKAAELGDLDAQRAAAWEVVSKEMESIKLGFLPAEKRAEADQKIAQVNQKAAQARQDAEKNLETKVNVEDPYSTTTLPADGKAKAAPVYDPKTGQPIFMAPASAAKELNDQGAKAQGVLDALEEMLKIEEGKTWGIPNNLVPVGEIAHQREQAAMNVASAYKRMEGTNLGRGMGKEVLGFIEELSGASGEAHLRNKADEIKKAMEVIRSNLANSYKVKGAGEVAPKKAENAGQGARPAPKQQKPAESSAKADHDFIANALNRDVGALDAQRTAAFEEAQGWLESGDPKLRAKAEKVFKIIRGELPRN